MNNDEVSMTIIKFSLFLFNILRDHINHYSTVYLYCNSVSILCLLFFRSWKMSFNLGYTYLKKKRMCWIIWRKSCLSAQVLF